MQTIVLFHNSKWYAPVWALLFVLSLVLLCFQRKKWERGYHVFFWLITISLGIVYCPFLANILVPRFLPSFAEYERLSWIFFEIPLISYTLIMLSDEFTNTRYKYIFFAACLAVLVFFGSPDNRVYYQKAQNRYKVSQDAITVCNAIDSLSPKGRKNICVQLETSKHYYSGNYLDGMLYYGIRMYESRFQLRYHVVDPQLYAQDGFILSKELPPEIDYYICPKAERLYTELERLGYSYVDESDNFAIFHNNSKPTDGEGS